MKLDKIDLFIYIDRYLLVHRGFGYWAESYELRRVVEELEIVPKFNSLLLDMGYPWRISTYYPKLPKELKLLINGTSSSSEFKYLGKLTEELVEDTLLIEELKK